VTVIEPNQHSEKKLFSTSNGFGVQLTEIISTEKWFGIIHNSFQAIIGKHK